MKPLISYYGGKQRICPHVVPIIEQIPHTVYCEPFFGGGAVFYARQKSMVSNRDDYREIINDRSELLINLYRVARSNPQRFYEEIQLTPYSRAEHKRAIEICKNPSEYNDFDKAWAYYVNIQQSFSNKLNSGWGTCVFGRNLATTWHNHCQRLPECLNRLQDIHIECDEALSVIERWSSPQTIFYVDPPYPSTNQGHYDGYTLDDWQALCDLLDRIDSSYVLSNYSQAIEPASAQQRIEVSAVASSSSQGKTGKGRSKRAAATQEELGNRERTEVLWVCDRSHNIRTDLDRVLAKRQQMTIFDIA